MPRRFFRRFKMKRDAFRERWFLAPFDHLLHDPNLWGIRRRTVVPAFAIGILVAFLPFPGHPLIAAFVALSARANIPVAALTTFVSNPLTMGPMYYFAHRVGQTILGLPPRPLDFELSWDWLREGFLASWQPLMLGCVLLGTVAAAIGYVVLDVLWRLSIADYLAVRRKRKQQASRNDSG